MPRISALLEVLSCGCKRFGSGRVTRCPEHSAEAKAERIRTKAERNRLWQQRWRDKRNAVRVCVCQRCHKEFKPPDNRRKVCDSCTDPALAKAREYGRSGYSKKRRDKGKRHPFAGLYKTKLYTTRDVLKAGPGQLEKMIGAMAHGRAMLTSFRCDELRKVTESGNGEQQS